MDIEGSIRKIGKETRPQDLSDLMVGERILLRVENSGILEIK
jgi:hypothetical protein